MAYYSKSSLFGSIIGPFFSSVTSRACLVKMNYFNGFRKISSIFPNKNLATLISNYLGKNYDDEVICDELFLIKYFWYDEDKISISNFEGLQYLMGLQVITIYNNKFEQLPHQFKCLTNIKKIRLINGNLKSIPEWIDNLIVLNDLELVNQNISSLPNHLFELKRLKILNLTKNNISELPQSIERLCFLKYLDISYNNINTLPNNLIYLEKLHKLNLSGNKIELNQLLYDYLCNINIVVFDCCELKINGLVNSNLWLRQINLLKKYKKIILGGILVSLFLLKKDKKKWIKK